MRMSSIHASISSFLDVLRYWSRDEFRKAWELSQQKQSSNPHNVNNIYLRTFNNFKIDYLFQSSSKLQQVIKIFEKCDIIKENPKLEDGNWFNGRKKILVFAITMIKCKIIELVSINSTFILIKYPPNQASKFFITRSSLRL